MEIVCFLDRRPWDPAGGAGAAPVRPSPVALGSRNHHHHRLAVAGHPRIRSSQRLRRPPPPHARARAHTRRKLTHPTPPPAWLPARGRGHATAAAAGLSRGVWRTRDGCPRTRPAASRARAGSRAGARAPMRVPLSASAAYMCAGVARFFCCLLSLLAKEVRDGLLLLGWQFDPFTYLPVSKNPHRIRFVLHLVLMGFLLGQKLYSTGIRAWIVTTHTCFVRLLEKPTDMWALSQISINITI